MNDQSRIIAGFLARLGDTACSRALTVILFLITCASSPGWAQGPGLPPKTCSDGRQRYICQGDLIATEGGNGTGSLVLIDPVSGAQTLISQGGLLQETVGVVVESTGNLVATNRLSGLVRVNPADGSQTLIYPSYNPLVNDFFGITIDANGNFIVTDSGLDPTTPYPGRNINHPGRVLLIDKATGALQVLADGSSTGMPLLHPYGVTTDLQGHIVVSDMSAYNNQGAIFQLPSGGGNPVPLWGPSGIAPAGTFVVQTRGVNCPMGITADPVSGNILATVFSKAFGVYGCAQVGGTGGEIFRVNLQTMAQETVAGPGIVDDPFTGQTYGQFLTYPFGILFDLNRKIVFVDEGYAGVYRMDPQTGYLMICTTCASATWDPNAAARGGGIVLSGGNNNIPNLLRGACNCGSTDSIAMVTSQPPALTEVPPVLPSSGTTCNGTFNGTFIGNLTVSNGQTCIFNGGGVTGNVTQTGGSLMLSHATVGGNVQVQGGGTIAILSSTSIIGNLQVQHLPAGPTGNQVCGATIKGDLQYQNNGAAVEIGASSGCPGNKIGGNLQIGSNTAPTVVSNNNVTGDLQDQTNTASTQTTGNTVGGNLQVQNNTGPSTQVSNNAVTKSLQCENNSSITGGGNTAQQKQDQCSSF